jgi:hypothetical protein
MLFIVISPLMIFQKLLLPGYERRFAHRADDDAQETCAVIGTCAVHEEREALVHAIQDTVFVELRVGIVLLRLAEDRIG